MPGRAFAPPLLLEAAPAAPSFGRNFGACWSRYYFISMHAAFGVSPVTRSAYGHALRLAMLPARLTFVLAAMGHFSHFAGFQQHGSILPMSISHAAYWLASARHGGAFRRAVASTVGEQKFIFYKMMPRPRARPLSMPLYYEIDGPD